MIDDDGGGKFDLIGVNETTLGNIMNSRPQSYTGDLMTAGKNCG